MLGLVWSHNPVIVLLHHTFYQIKKQNCYKALSISGLSTLDNLTILYYMTTFKDTIDS